MLHHFINKDAADAPVAEELFTGSNLLITVLDGIADRFFVKDTEGRYLMRNRASRDASGWPDSEVIGKTVLEMPFPPDHAQRYHDDDMRVIATGIPIINREEPHVRLDGGVGVYLTSKYPIRNISGKIIGLAGVARDVTEVRRANQDLMEARAGVSAHLDHMQLSVFELDADLRIVRWAGRAEELLGWSAREAEGRFIHEFDIVHEEDRERVAAAFERLRSGEEKSNTHANRNTHRDGSIRHCNWHNSVLRGHDGAARSYLCVAQDVTQHMQRMGRLHDSDRLLGTLIEATNTGYVLLDASGRILQANDKYMPYFGFHGVEDILGRFAMDLVKPDTSRVLAAALEQTLRLGFVHNLEIDVDIGRGNTVPFELNAKVEHTQEGPRIHLFFRDICQRRDAVRERQAIEQKLQEAQKLESLGVLAGGIAHDFNNLLTGILGNASLAASELPPGAPAQQNLEQIEKATWRAADLCKQMLNYSGKGRLVVGTLDLNLLVQETTELLRLSISKRTQLRFSLAEQRPFVCADATQLRQVIMNLVINASEATIGGDGMISVATGRIHADAAFLANFHSSHEACPGEYVWIEVADNGAGMSPEVRAKIFDPFFTTKSTGRGLGLAAVIGIIRSHKGAMNVSSEMGKGTTFKVLLPAADAKSAPNPALNPAPTQAVPAWAGKGSVLVVDDEEAVRITTSRMLESLGLEVVCASNGREAMEIFTKRPDFSVVLLDLTMPLMDGEATFQALRKLRADTRVVLMSGFNEQEAMARFAGKGISGFVQKPFNVAVLRAKFGPILA